MLKIHSALNLKYFPIAITKKKPQKNSINSTIIYLRRFAYLFFSAKLPKHFRFLHTNVFWCLERFETVEKDVWQLLHLYFFKFSWFFKSYALENSFPHRSHLLLLLFSWIALIWAKKFFLNVKVLSHISHLCRF